ncbi:hypothetical protein Ddc_01741 [Ditylenchus destructor]|nr:hypothetical protein Ddc_01741 [Ditylenchus destructor]
MQSRNSTDQSANDDQSDANSSTSTPMKCYYGHYRDGSLERMKRQQWEQERATRKDWFPFDSQAQHIPPVVTCPVSRILIANKSASTFQENGHHRDGSLTRKKQEQWEKEKTLLGPNWYPFGSSKPADKDRNWANVSAGQVAESARNLRKSPVRDRIRSSLRHSVTNGTALGASNLKSMLRHSTKSTESMPAAPILRKVSGKKNVTSRPLLTSPPVTNWTALGVSNPTSILRHSTNTTEPIPEEAGTVFDPFNRNNETSTPLLTSTPVTKGTALGAGNPTSMLRHSTKSTESMPAAPILRKVSGKKNVTSRPLLTSPPVTNWTALGVSNPTSILRHSTNTTEPIPEEAGTVFDPFNRNNETSTPLLTSTPVTKETALGAGNPTNSGRKKPNLLKDFVPKNK